MSFTQPTAAPNRALRMTLLALAVAGVVVAVAWTTELRAALHAGLLALCVFAFLPFVIIAALIGVILAIGLVLGLLGGDAHAADLAGFGEGLLYSKRGIQTYYGFLAQHRGSVWLGVPAGLLLGTFVVWGLLAWLVVPHELRTTELLLGLKTQIDKHYAERADYPAQRADSGFPGPNDAPQLDDFGRPLRYEVQGKWRTKSYRLTSNGADGVPSEDDLCIEGRTKLQKVLDTSSALLNLADMAAHLRSGAPVKERMSVLQAVRCQNEPLSRASLDN